GFGFYWTE
ncbi:putative glycosyltransferase, partial [Vibrio parahaemolyticus 10296]